MQTEELDNLLEAYRELYPNQRPWIYLDENTKYYWLGKICQKVSQISLEHHTIQVIPIWKWLLSSTLK